MKRLLISSPEQFGYLTDTYKYCQYLSDDFDIDYVCFDQGYSKIELNNVNIIYLKKINNILLRYLYLNFYISVRSYVRNYHILFCVYNPLVFILRLLILFKPIVLDIRTGSVDKNSLKRIKANKKIMFNTKFFKHITIISETLATYLKIDMDKCDILPLGADRKVVKSDDHKNKMYLLYVGILSGRRIIDSIKGYKMFVDKYGEHIDCEYNIIGYFNEGCSEKEMFFNQIEQVEKVNYLGKIYHQGLDQYYYNSNIGVSYIPITEYYDYQPPTKTFEYLQNGLITIATGTKENSNYINNDNGVLCKDNPESFFTALEEVYNNLDNYEIEKVRDTVKEYTWEKIVTVKLEPYIYSLLKR